MCWGNPIVLGGSIVHQEVEEYVGIVVGDIEGNSQVLVQQPKVLGAVLLVKDVGKKYQSPVKQYPELARGTTYPYDSVTVWENKVDEMDKVDNQDSYRYLVKIARNKTIDKRE